MLHIFCEKLDVTNINFRMLSGIWSLLPRISFSRTFTKHELYAAQAVWAEKL